MGGIMSRLEGALVSSLEPIVVTGPHRHVESFARHILQTTTTAVIESRPAQRLSVAAPMTDAQATVLPEFSGRAEATGRVNVSTEATGPNGTNTRRRAQQLDFRENLGHPQHQLFRFRL